MSNSKDLNAATNVVRFLQVSYSVSGRNQFTFLLTVYGAGGLIST